MFRRYLIAFASLIFVIPMCLPAGTTPLPLHFCDVLENLSKYRGKVIEVRGEWVANTLWRETCVPLKTKDYTWITAFNLEYPTEAKSIDDSDVYWTLDPADLDKAGEQALTLQKLVPNGTVSATIIGRLDAREHLEVFGTAEGFDKTTPHGYGHLGQYPAELVVIAIKDVRITSKGER